MDLCRRNTGRYSLYYGGRCPLSNMYRCSFTNAEGLTFNSSEQYYQYYKALAFGDISAADEIIASTDPYAAKRLAKRIEAFDAKKWRDGECNEVMKKAVDLKFSQNLTCRQYLLQTRPIIAEASPYDGYFGIGLRLTDPRAVNHRLWPGRNRMGVILMNYRAEIRHRIEPTPVTTDMAIALDDDWSFTLKHDGRYIVRCGDKNVSLPGTVIELIGYREALKTSRLLNSSVTRVGNL